MSEVSTLLRDTADRLFADHCDRATLERAEAGVWPEALWRALEEAGFPKALLPEAAGGAVTTVRVIHECSGHNARRPATPTNRRIDATTRERTVQPGLVWRMGTSVVRLLTP